MTPLPPLLVDEYGDSAVMVTVDSPDADLRRRSVVAFRDAFVARRPHGVTDVVAGLESLLVEYDPLATAPEHVIPAARLIGELAGEAEVGVRRVFDLPVVFDEQNGPDLAGVADELGLSAEQVVDRLLDHELTIVLLAAAMAPMMAGVTLPAPVRRQSQPRTNVPEGSIMIAGVNAIIQPFPGPTGWRVVGRSPLTIVDIARESPVSFAPGDVVRLRRIAADEAEALRGEFLEAGRD